MAYFSTEPASQRRNINGKKRVWDFFPLSSKTHPANRRQPAQPRRKIDPTATKAASGIPCWPSKDPMGELGGMNLYLFVANCPTRWFDILGLSEIGDALELIGDQKKFITKKLEKKLLESFPAAKAAAMAAELGKEIAEEVDSRVKNVKKKLEKSGYSLQYISMFG